MSSPHAMHAAVLSSFAPGIDSDDSGRVLWRLETRADGGVWLVVVSPREPEMIHIAEQAGWPTQHLGESKPYLPFIERVDDAQEWMFQIVANPVHTVTDEAGRKRKLGHVTAAQQQAWFVSKAEQHGFAVVTSDDGVAELELRDRVVRTFARNAATVTLTTAAFAGRLRVTDAHLLRQTLALGLGRAKGYGCGLLTLSPIRPSVSPLTRAADGSPVSSPNG